MGKITVMVMDALIGPITKEKSAIKFDGIKKQAEELTKGATGRFKGLFGK